jgi:diamine N-acetyltransferase
MLESLLQSKYLILRAVEPQDSEIIFKWENNTQNWQVSNTLVPFSMHTIKQYALNTSHDIFENKQLRLMIVVKKENRPVGAVDLFDYDPFHQRAGVGILINDKEDRGKGYAKEALEIVKNYAFNYLHLHQLYCSIGADNVKSQHLFVAMGFVKCGTRKAWLKTMDGWIDEQFYQCFNKNS